MSTPKKKQTTPKSKQAPRRPRQPQASAPDAAAPAIATTVRGPFYFVHGVDADWLVPVDLPPDEFGRGPLRFDVTDWRSGDEILFTYLEAGVVEDFAEAQRLRLEYLVALKHNLQMEIDRVMAIRSPDQVPVTVNPFERVVTR